MIAKAQSSPADFEELLVKYWSPVYASLRRKGKNRDDAADLTQAFLADVVIGRDLISKARPERGRFRSFLMTALKNYEIDTIRRERGRNGKRVRVFLPDDPELLAAAEPSDADDPTRAFDRQWATAVVEEALVRMEKFCRDDGMHPHWRVFEARIISPTLHGCEPASIEKLTAQLGARDGVEISSLLHTAKRKFRSILREVIGETLQDPADLELEFAELRKFLVL